MRRTLGRFLWLGLVIEISCRCHSALAGQLQAVSVADSGQPPPAGGSGDSIGPIISQDGRYVLFASTANNLVLTASNTPMPVLIPPKLNVVLRDRTNGTTTLVSVNLAGTGGGNGDSLPVAISTNGQFVLFESTAGDLVPGDTNGVNDVFIRDVVGGTTLLVSANTNGNAGNGFSQNSVMTPDGRYVAFTSAASDLVPFDTNVLADVFVRNMQTGTTTLASVGAVILPVTPSNVAGNKSDWAEISADGRYVVFFSTVTNLVPGVRTSGDIYVRDLIGGSTIWASAGARPMIQTLFSTTNTNIVCQNHTISADGQYVAYEARPIPSSGLSTFGVIFRFNVLTSQIDVISTNAGVSAQTYDDPRNLSMTPDGQTIAFVGRANISGSNNTCILVWSAATGSNVLASVNLSNSVSTNAIFDWPVIDPAARYVAFQSSAIDLTTNSLLGTYHLFLRDLQTGTTTLVDSDTYGVGTGVGPDAVPSLSTNGPSVALEAPDGILVANDSNRALDVFVRNVAAGTNEMISACQPGLSSVSPDGLSGITATSVSANGRFVAFTSDADNLIQNDTNGWRDVFLRDLMIGTNILVSASTNGGVGDGESFGASISADGRYVAFTSSASNLVANDFNNFQDVFVRDTQSGTTALVSVNTNGVSGGSDSFSAIISSNGQHILFQTKATDLVPGMTYLAGSQNLFLRDLQANVTHVLTSNGVVSVSTTPDGRYVLLTADTVSPRFYVWDTQAFAPVYSNQTLFSPAASIDGNVIVVNQSNMILNQSNSLVVLNRASNTMVTLIFGRLFMRGSFNLSSDGRWLAYATTAPLVASDGNSLSDVYLYDMVAGTNCLVSHRSGSSSAGNAASDVPTMTGNGRYIAYRSTATNLTPDDINGSRSIFLYDQTNGSTRLITCSQFGNMAANSHSMLPVFSGDGQTLVFQSWSSDLVAQDGNPDSAVFAYALITNGVGQPFFAQIVVGGQAGATPTISWTAVPGKTYIVQYKNNVTDAGWQNASGGTTIVGNQALFTDPAPSPNQRFYRIVAF